MLPIYKKGVRYITGSYIRTKKQAVVLFLVLGLLLVLLLGLVGFATFYDSPVAVSPTSAAPARKQTKPLAPRHFKDGRRDKPQLDGKQHIEKTPPLSKKFPETYSMYRIFFPLIAGFSFGFVGSIPIAGPTSAMVLKLGIQGKYYAGHAVALGGATAEATYAGIAFWGFGSFLAGVQFLLPASKVLGAIMFLIIGVVFLKSDITPQMDNDAEVVPANNMSVTPRGEFFKNLLLGLTMSGINPALLATYTGAIASVYGTGLLEFTASLSFVFATGVCAGVSTWFFVLLSLLKKYKQRIKNQTLSMVMRTMGCFLTIMGLLCAKSSFEYFFLV